MVRSGSKIPVGLAIVAVVVLVGSTLIWRVDRGEPRFGREVRQALGEGRIDAAAAVVDRWLTSDPGSAEAHLLRGRITLERSRPAEAASELRRALELGGATPGAVLLRALIAAKLGRVAEAEPELTRVFDKGKTPDRAVDAALAKIRIEAFDLQRAGPILDRWVDDFPTDPQPHLWRAEIHSRTGGDATAALNDYRAALRLGPNLVDARLKLADELGKQHQQAEALAEYSTILANRPDDPRAHLGAARALAGLDNEIEATRHLDRALALNPDNPEVHRARADAASRRGDWTAMLGSLDRALALDPDDLPTHYQRGMALASLGRADEARAELALATRLRTDLDRLNQARKRLITAPRDHASHLEIARWMFAHAHAEDGVRWAEKILHEWPDDPEASRLLTDHHRQAGNPGLANYYQLHAAPASPAASPGGRVDP